MKLLKAPTYIYIYIYTLENTPWRLLLLTIKISSSFLVLFDDSLSLSTHIKNFLLVFLFCLMMAW